MLHLHKLIWASLAAFLLLLCPFAAATEPPYIDNDVLIIPYTTDGSELTADNWFKISDNFYLYSWEQDADYQLKIWMVNYRTIGLRIETNPFRIVNPYPNIEICIGENDVFDIPGLKKNQIHEPINCRGGQAVSFEAVNTNIDYSFMLKEIPTGFEFFIGQGAGGGGGVLGCVPLPNCDIITLDNYCTPSSSNTETNFCYGVFARMITEPGCSCALEFKDNPISLAHYVITSTYQSYYTKPQAKLISGLASRTISSSGNYHITAQCGGMDGTLNLRATGGSAGNYDKTLSCNDVQNPKISTFSPPNNYIYNNQTQHFKCNATDNTALRNITLYANFSGSYQYEGSQAYSGLTYSATATFTKDLSQGVYKWSCRAIDTAPNIEFTGNRTIYINSTCNYIGSGDWFLKHYCILDNSLVIQPNDLNITEGGQLNITTTGLLNASNIFYKPWASWRIKSKGTLIT